MNLSNINGKTDIFVRDRQTGQTSLVSVNSSEEQASYHCFEPSISADGRSVAFHSRAGNLATPDDYSGEDVFLRDRQTGETIMVSVDSNGDQGAAESNYASISADGRYVAFQSEAKLVPGDTDSFDDVYVHDRITGQTVCASVDSEGNHDSGDCYYPSISPDGRWVAFRSAATNLVAGDTNGKTDIFLHGPIDWPGSNAVTQTYQLLLLD